MAVQNKLGKATEGKKEQGVTYEVNGLQITLTPQTVRDYLVSGDKEKVSIKELAMFINLCKFSKLNPWLKEAYCIKYGNEPATMVIGKGAFEKRAEEHPAYDGQESGIVVSSEDGEIIYRNGALKLEGEKLLGGYAQVWRKDRSHSYRIEVSFEEYVGRKKDGTLNSQWSKRPSTMIRKVALVQALREAFPKSFSGMYTAEEQGEVEPDFNISEVMDLHEQNPSTDQQPEQIQDKESYQDVQMALFGQ